MARRQYQNPSVLCHERAGGKEWYVRYKERTTTVTPEGPKEKIVERWEPLGLCSEVSKREAERKRDEIMARVNAAVFHPRIAVKFSALLDLFIDKYVPTLSVPSQATYKEKIENYIRPALGEMMLCDIETQHCTELFEGMEKKGLSRGTRSNTFGILKSIWSRAIEWKYTETSPVKGSKIGGGPKRVRERRVPTLDQVRALIAACDGDIPLLLETLYATGMRVSEGAALVVRDLDFAAGSLTVWRRYSVKSIAQPKSKKPRVLPLGIVAEKLKAHVAGKAPDDPVFLYNGAMIDGRALTGNYLTPRMKKLGIKFPGFGCHTFRRLHATKAQMTVWQLQGQLGHADVRTTQDYVCDDLDERSRAAAALPTLDPVAQPEPEPAAEEAKRGLFLVRKAG